MFVFFCLQQGIVWIYDLIYAPGGEMHVLHCGVQTAVPK